MMKTLTLIQFFLLFAYNCTAQCCLENYKQGVSLYNTGNYETAKIHFQQAMKCSDAVSDPGCRNVESWICKCNSKILESRDKFKEVCYKTHWENGQSKFKNGYYSEAKTAFIEALKCCFQPESFAVKLVDWIDSCNARIRYSNLVNPGNSVTDINGNIYKTVKIGNQVWMAENLKVTKYRNGDQIPILHGSYTLYEENDPGCMPYGNKASMSSTYGFLYNWYVVSDQRGICPKGWHIPDDSEWDTLARSLGGNETAGQKMKEKGTTHWTNEQLPVSNSSGFNALPGGYFFLSKTSERTKGYAYYSYINEKCYFWSSSEQNVTDAWCRYLSNSDNVMKREHDSESHGYSVRCIKD